MDERKFLEDFTTIFDDISVDDLNMDIVFRDIDEWSSLAALGLLAVMNEEYGVELNNDDIRNSNTIRDIYNIVKSKQ